MSWTKRDKDFDNIRLNYDGYFLQYDGYDLIIEGSNWTKRADETSTWTLRS